MRAVPLALCALVLLTACDSLPGGDGAGPYAVPPDLQTAFQNPGTWAFAESAALTCRDGSSTGIGVRLQQKHEHQRPDDPFRLDAYSDDLVLFLEGGGACFNAPTCSDNQPSFSRAQFFSDDFIGGYSGIFDDARADNPVGGWNFIYVPFCTGDVHAGSAPNGSVPPLDVDFDGEPDLPGPENQRFVGYDNVGRVLDYIRRYLNKDYDRILLAGASAGGFGTLVNYRQVREAFPEAEVVLLDDSGPIFYDDAVLPAALQELWRTTWDLGEAFPQGSGGAELEDIYASIATSYPEASLGFISHEQDFIIRFFYSFGQALTDPACAQRLFGGLAQEPPRRKACVEGDTYEEALYALRARLPDPWVTFYTGAPDPLQHTFLQAERFYEAQAGGQALSSWVQDLIGGSAQDRGGSTP